MRHVRKKQTIKKQQGKRPNEKSVETKENLTLMLSEYEKKLKQSGYRMIRLKDLLARKSVIKLSENKLNKMKRQLLEAEEEYSFSQVAIDQITFRLTQIT